MGRTWPSFIAILPPDPLTAVLVRNAVTTGVDTRLRFASRNYEATGNVGLTFLDGEPAAIARVQQASTHYLQRLDQPTIRFDPTRRALNGLQTTASLSKVSGRHRLWGTGTLMIASPEFDPSDFGRLNYAGDLTVSPRVTYRETQPGRLFRAGRAADARWSVDGDAARKEHDGFASQCAGREDRLEWERQLQDE